MKFADKKYWKKLTKNQRKYFIAAAIFFIWMVYPDSNSFYDIWQYKQRINNLKEERKFYIEKIVEDSTKLEQLKSKEMIEKFARERYFMKAPDEDVYVIIEEE